MKNLSIAGKIALPGILIAIVVSIGLFFAINAQQRDIAVMQARKTAQAISTQVAADRAVYTSEVVGKLKADGISQVHVQHNYEGTPGAIPLPATFVHRTSAHVNASKSGSHTIDLLSLWKINAAKGPRDAWETEALTAVARDMSEIKDTPEERDGQDVYRAVTADVANAQSCVDCHNQTEANTGKKDFQKGDVMGGLVISMPMTAEFSKARANAVVLTFALFGAFFLLLALQWVLVNRPLVKTITDLEAAADRISRGMVDSPITSDRTDELGKLTKAFERMRASLAMAMKHSGGGGSTADEDDGL